jgi:hypothetical protein
MNEQDKGAPVGPGSHASTEPAGSLGPTGFDPSRLSLDPISTDAFLALSQRERFLNAIGDAIAHWISWETKKRGESGLDTPDDAHVWLNGYEGAPPYWPDVGTLKRWLFVLRGGSDFTSDSDGPRMAETAKHGSGRSPPARAEGIAHITPGDLP